MYLHIYKTINDKMFAILSVDTADKKLEQLAMVKPRITADLYKSFTFANNKANVELIKKLTLEIFDKYDFTFSLINFDENIIKDLFTRYKESIKVLNLKPKKKTFKDLSIEDIKMLSNKSDKYVYNYCLLNKISDKKEISLVFKRINGYKKQKHNKKNSHRVHDYKLEKDFNIKPSVLENIKDNVESNDILVKYEQMVKLYNQKSFTKIVD